MTALSGHSVNWGQSPINRNALELRGLAVGHGQRALVRDVCLAVRPGQVVALIGPNGSGKTTILRTVAGQLRALGGVVELFGRPLAEVPPAERAQEMAVMLTGRPSTELLTCRDVVEAGRYPFTGRLGVLGEKDHEAVRAALEATGAAELAERLKQNRFTLADYYDQLQQLKGMGSMEDIANNIATFSVLKNRAGSAGSVMKNVSFNNGTCRVSTENVETYSSMSTFTTSKKEANMMDMQKRLMERQKNVHTNRNY